MFYKFIIFQIVFSIFCIFINADQTINKEQQKISLTQKKTNDHFKQVKKEIDIRWQNFQKNKTFKLFKPKRSNASLKKEFKDICLTRISIWKAPEYKYASQLIENDQTRVLKCTAFDYNNTVSYYNASTICIKNKFYIACEGPRAKDVFNFFHFLTTHPITHIVRLTSACEGKTEKCHPYWQGLFNKTSDGYGYLNIPKKTDIHSIRAFDISYWKDNKGIAPDKLLNVVLHVKQELDNTKSLPVIHCSAGVGRTGTFIAALAIIDAIDKNESFSIEEIVYRLSLQRVYSVAKADQYVSLYRLAELYLKK
jgi:protein tyrosine phosphatase